MLIGLTLFLLGVCQSASSRYTTTPISAFEIVPEAPAQRHETLGELEEDVQKDMVNQMSLKLKWGPTGHALTAALALKLIAPTTRECVRRLVPDLEAGAQWPDVARKTADYKWSGHLHFASVPAWDCRFQPADCPKDGCVVTAIANYTHRLRNTRLTAAERAEALKFVSHLLGDVHQPLHVGFGRDKGGNSIKGSFLGQATNLHEVWDDLIINKRIADDFSPDDGRFGEAGGDKAYVYFLSQQATKMQRATLHPQQGEAPLLLATVPPCQGHPAQPALCPEQWAEESANLACQYGYKDGHGAKLSVASGFSFALADYTRLLPVIEARLVQGGVRLSELLDRACDAGSYRPSSSGPASSESTLQS